MTILEPGQWRVRDLVMGPHTDYRVLATSNTFGLTVRADQSRPRPYTHGELVGAEWARPKTAPIRVMIDAPPYTESAWLDAVDALTEAFRPVEASGDMVELYRNIDGREYVWFGRPRVVEPETDLAAGGYGFVQCAFEMPDPRRYSAGETSASTGLAIQQGGLTVPMSAPVTVGAVRLGGQITLTNTGTAPTWLRLRIDGPVPEPGIVLHGPTGIQSLRFSMTLLDGQWLEIDSTNRLALLNGLAAANRRPNATWLMDTHPLRPRGTTTVRFTSSGYDEAALLTATARSAWW